MDGKTIRRRISPSRTNKIHRRTERLLFKWRAVGVLRAALYCGLVYLALFVGPTMCQGKSGCWGNYYERVWLSIGEPKTKLYCTTGDSNCASCNNYCCPGGNCGNACYGYTLITNCSYVPLTCPDTLTASGSVSCSGSGGWCRGSATLELTASDSLGHTVTFTGSGAPGFPCTAPCSLSLPEGIGTYSWTATCAGGKTASGSGSWKLDATPPVLDSSLSGGTSGARGWYRGGPVTLSCTADDSLSGLAGLTYGNQTASAEGSTVLTCTAGDAAGNTSNASYTIQIDSIAPAALLDYSGIPGSGGWYTSPVTVTLDASDGGSGIFSASVRANGGGWNSSVTLGDGSYSIEGLAEDNAGNTASSSGSVRVDTQPPMTEWGMESDGWYSGKVTLTGSSYDATSGIESVYLSFDGSNWVRISSSANWIYEWDTTLVPDGPYELLARADDAAGNREHTAAVTIRVDNTPPTVSLTPRWGAASAGDAEGTDSGSGIARSRVTVSREGMVPWVRDYSSVPPVIRWDQRDGNGNLAGHGDFQVHLEVWDRAGNSADAHAMIFNPEPTAVPKPTKELAMVVAKPHAAESAPQKSIPIPGIPVWTMALPLLGIFAWLGTSGAALLCDRRWSELRTLGRSVSGYRAQRKTNFKGGDEDD
jgi:Bacterial Ig domain